MDKCHQYIDDCKLHGHNSFKSYLEDKEGSNLWTCLLYEESRRFKTSKSDILDFGVLNTTYIDIKNRLIEQKKKKYSKDVYKSFISLAIIGFLISIYTAFRIQ